jgi:heme a synthase
MKLDNTLLNIARIACFLAFTVIVLGAYTRLSHAGLGCPDWPGCYGKLIVPESAGQVAEANVAYPDRPLEQAKAWKEMVHRYAASTLGLLILVMAMTAWLKSQFSHMRLFSTALLGLVIFQGLLGMWTVTLLLKPVIVMSHLLGGLTILSLLYWTILRQQSRQGVFVSAENRKLLPLAIAGLIVLILQISLGGWTSSNYAALACPDFPTCQGVWWPNMDFNEGFILWRGLGIDYEGGVLHGSARTAIHMAHRIGAVIAFIVIAGIAVQAIKSGIKPIKLTGLAALILLITQVSLGIANIELYLPLSVAVAHNGVAALLLLSLVTLLHHCLPED